MRFTTLFAGLMLVAGLAQAAAPDNNREPEGPPPPPMPATDSPAAPEPEVTIVEKADATISEYRMKGKLYMMRVVPKVGAPYYLIDREGNGRFSQLADNGGDNLSPPRWVLLEW
ncbi:MULTISPECIES: DUF2782 domain-containing protein [Silvimonas]|uniref:DUF2782 domain-containing protein n=1 Tax=Silvimonas TaxID=300264 RepID=UPI0024B3BAF0|nr:MULTISPECIES: DUF2782 domain-containing protein [Silvimonas]MDR3429768.1 DUF2782 domain-containing protein [Silvimonas sp.]